MPINWKISFQKSPLHLVSLSEITCHRIPNLDMTCLKNNFVVSSSVILVEAGIMIVYLVSLSMITKMLLNPLETGNSGIKSILTTSKGSMESVWVVVVLLVCGVLV